VEENLSHAQAQEDHAQPISGRILSLLFVISRDIT
jgi:hypothetical protein